MFVLQVMNRAAFVPCLSGSLAGVTLELLRAFRKLLEFDLKGCVSNLLFLESVQKSARHLRATTCEMRTLSSIDRPRMPRGMQVLYTEGDSSAGVLGGRFREMRFFQRRVTKSCLPSALSFSQKRCCGVQNSLRHRKLCPHDGALRASSSPRLAPTALRLSCSCSDGTVLSFEW